MLTRALRWGVSLVVLAGLAYFALFIRIGSRTLYEHACLIAETGPARSLGRDLSNASRKLGNEVVEKIRRPGPTGAEP